MLLDSGADIEATLSDGNRPLYVALINEREDVALLLINEGADIATRDFIGGTPLHLATHQGLREVSSVLLSKGLSTEAMDDASRTMLFFCNDAYIANMLVADGANVNHVDSSGWTTLHHAVSKRSVQVTEILLQAGGEIDVRSVYDGRDVMDLAEDLVYEEERDRFIDILKEAKAQRLLKATDVDETEYEMVIRGCSSLDGQS